MSLKDAEARLQALRRERDRLTKARADALRIMRCAQECSILARQIAALEAAVERG